MNEIKTFELQGLKHGIDVFIDGAAKIKRPELVELGNYIAIDAFCYITTGLMTGNYIHIATMTSIIGGKNAMLIMGDFCGLSAGTRIICASDDFMNSISSPLIPDKFKVIKNKPVIMEGFNVVGTNGIVFPGVRMAIGSCLGAGAVLTKDTKPWMIYTGIPAKSYKMRDRDKILSDAKLIK